MKRYYMLTRHEFVPLPEDNAAALGLIEKWWEYDPHGMLCTCDEGRALPDRLVHARGRASAAKAAFFKRAADWLVQTTDPKRGRFWRNPFVRDPGDPQSPGSLGIVI